MSLLNSEVSNMENGRNSPSKSKKRLWVPGGLYDFKDDELEFIAKSREISEDASSSNELGLGPQDEEVGDDKDASSDTESMYQSCNGSVHNLGFLESSPKENPEPDSTSISSYAYSSSSSSFDGYEETEFQRNIQGEDILDCAELSPGRNALVESIESRWLSSDDLVDGGMVRQKKIIVPEPELSDPYFCLEDSLEMEPEKVSPDSEYLSLVKKLSLTSTQKTTYSGGFLGSYVVRREIRQPYISANTNTLYHDGYFRIWLSKLRNLHLFA